MGEPVSVTLRSGDFTTSLLLKRLVEMPLPNWRKLLKLARYEDENAEALHTIAIYFSATAPVLKELWRVESEKYMCAQDDAARKKQIINVKHAKAQYDRLIKFQNGLK